LGPEALAQVLRPLRIPSHPDLLTRLTDDAAVYRLAPDQLLVQTVDFFTPIVDDPWTYGAIAAANSLSDIYAMGARPFLALAVAALPDWLPSEMGSAIFQGGADKVAEAGAVLAGGHTITDAEPKYGLCVTGLAHPDHLTPKAGAQPGDLLVLSKPLGTGVVTTAFRQEQARDGDYQAAVASMLRLNRSAADLARSAGSAHAVTDVTGFGLLGHAAEIARNSEVCLRFTLDDLPLLPGALDYARAGIITGGAGRNHDWLQHEGLLQLGPGLDRAALELAYDPQTSGGLLLVLPPERAERLLSAAERAGEPMWRIGTVIAGHGVEVV
jgi:selenide,water dikinase